MQTVQERTISRQLRAHQSQPATLGGASGVARLIQCARVLVDDAGAAPRRRGTARGPAACVSVAPTLHCKRSAHGGAPVTDAVWIVTLLSLVVWRCLHDEATAPDDPMLWIVGQLLTAWRALRAARGGARSGTGA